ncbi:MAG: alanine--tRNA ligase [Bacteroidota bacterium]|nr:alanine--tRNA ligase [Bacteroidota bacterium]
MTSVEIRKKFLEFFELKKHKIVDSAPMVVKNDPTLMFTNAGMNQFKEYFLGNAEPKSLRIANTQKCLRVSGKHNDLEEVGIDTYHHTFFEMLGNWSFGDYFKEEAIKFAWELLTEVFKIDPETLYVTVFEGDKKDYLDKDNDAYKFWKAIVPEDRIILGSKKDNFWEMGENGPCGPCSEIHIDIRDEEEKRKKSGALLINKDHPEVIEIWNLVFIEFNRKSDGSLEKLPKQHVDTGMGFERLCMILQSKKSSYDTDVFEPIIREIEVLTETKYGKDENTDRSIRVIADHFRTVYFSIAEGQLPSNNGAGYVIRRILRRAIRYGFTFLNKKEPFIYKLTDTLSQQLKLVFPELENEKKLVFNVVREEENSFLKTLDQGLVLLENITESNKTKTIDGKKAFELYDTFGFPIDLTALIAREKGFNIDKKQFDIEMEKQKMRSRSASSTKVDDWEILMEDDVEEFVGFDILETDVRIVKYRKVTTNKEGEFYQLVFNLTPFYPEGGGQVGDKGYLETQNGQIHYITDTKKENNVIVHFLKTIPERMEEKFKVSVDKKQRFRTSCNHTATHLLHQGLRSILGEHVEQKGSMVHSGMFRFDFSHFSKISSEEIKSIESFVNSRIQEQIVLEEERNIPYKEALRRGAIGLFGEKYGDTVRTIKFGQSYELCGGTHVKNTLDIWRFKIMSESSIASGIRRIESITGDAAIDYLETQTKTLESVNLFLKNPQDPLKAVSKLHKDNVSLRKEILDLQKLKVEIVEKEILNKIHRKNNISLVTEEVDLDSNAIKTLCFEMGKKHEDLLMIFASKKGNEAIIACYISKKLVDKSSFNAVKIINSLSTYIGGKGGGQPFFAIAGGKNPKGISKVLEKARKLI